MVNDYYVSIESRSIALALVGRFIAIDQPSGTLLVECDSDNDALEIFYHEVVRYSSIIE